MAHSKAVSKLPNGLFVHGLDQSAAGMIYDQVLEYFRNDVITVEEGMTVFDLGAHFGVFALEVLHRTGGDVHLHCFEPSPKAYVALETSVREQFPDADVTTYNIGISKRSGPATFYVRPNASCCSSLYSEMIPLTTENVIKMMRDPDLPSVYRTYPKWLDRCPDVVLRLLLRVAFRLMRRSSKILCQLKTLSQVIDEQGVAQIDLLKIDVEEAELDVLLGLEEQDWPKVRSLAMEVHDKNGRLDQIKTVLAGEGFGRVVIGQEYAFQGTDIFSVCCSRGSD